MDEIKLYTTGRPRSSPHPPANEWVRENAGKRVSQRTMAKLAAENRLGPVYRMGHNALVTEEGLAAFDWGQIGKGRRWKPRRHEPNLDKIKRNLDRLDGTERRVIEARYGLNGEPPHTLAQIGQRFFGGVTRQRAQQKIAPLLRELGVR